MNNDPEEILEDLGKTDSDIKVILALANAMNNNTTAMTEIAKGVNKMVSYFYGKDDGEPSQFDKKIKKGFKQNLTSVGTIIGAIVTILTIIIWIITSMKISNMEDRLEKEFKSFHKFQEELLELQKEKK